ncbi:MAG: DNA-packaging protein [Planctomycetaceae bacterium]|nr:DNA-packaging protein [Planctomycetaceae bacterium]
MAAKKKTATTKKASKTAPNLGGRPPYYDTPEELAVAAEQYFKSCDDNKRPYTVTGLALFLGFSSIQSLNDTAKREGFSEPVKRAKLRVECGYETALHDGKPVGAIFALKNFGWKDKQEHDLNHHNDLDSLLAAVEGEDDGGE